MSSTCAEADAADLIGVVCAVPGVRGIEAGVASALRTLDARVRRTGGARSRYGLVLDREQGTVTVEVSLLADSPVRKVVAAIQQAVQQALDSESSQDWQVLVRVQSIAAPSA